MNGMLIINKDEGMTSRDVVNIISKKFNTKKVGHTGTLDPIATGVLIVLIGNYTKLVDIITSKEKEYIAVMKLGVLTDTLDVTGNILDTKDYNVDINQIKNVLKSFEGEYEQEVPIYSAVKIDGKKLYEYALEGKSVELPKRNVNIKNIELLDYKDNLITFKVLVSKGTYIRSLIRDIANKLNTYGVMVKLQRTKQGNFDISDSYTLKDIENDNYKLLNYEDIFNNIDKLELNDEEYFKVSNGQKMPVNFNNDVVIYTYKNKYIAMYQKEDNCAKIKLMFKY